MKCLAIDDEPLALTVIKDFCAEIGFLDLVLACTNPLEAIEVINREEIDLLFIDIQMPYITGMDFIKTLPHPPLIIFTTAYSEHALEGFELNAVDYLLKPIPFERFFKAVNKAHELYTLRNRPVHPEPYIPDKISTSYTKSYILVKVEYTTVKVNVGDILFIEGLKDYIRIHLAERSCMTKSTLKKIAEKLPADQFIRVHKSYIVSIPKIEKIENNRIIFGDRYIPVGEHFRETFQNVLNKFRL